MYTTLLRSYISCIIIWYILLVVANWRIFTKAGEAGWKSIIPIYNSYILYKICWKTSVFWITLLIAVLGAVLTNIPVMIAAIIGSILGFAVGVISIIQLYKLSKAYGHGVGFTIGLIFLNPIFMLILGLGGSQYAGNDNQ